MCKIVFDIVLKQCVPRFHDSFIIRCFTMTTSHKMCSFLVLNYFQLLPAFSITCKFEQVLVIFMFAEVQLLYLSLIVLFSEVNQLKT